MAEKRDLPQKMITEEDVAVLLGVSMSTLREWRRTDYGPPYFKFKKAVRYKLAEVQDWLERQRNESTVEVG